MQEPTLRKAWAAAVGAGAWATPEVAPSCATVRSHGCGQSSKSRKSQGPLQLQVMRVQTPGTVTRVHIEHLN